MIKMTGLDEQEIKIVRELIKNPRSSDNTISRNTGVPVMTVNRKRKLLEESDMISYYVDLRHGDKGTEDFYAKQLYTIKFKLGLTKTEFLEKIRNDTSLKKFNAEHIVMSYLGEKDGHLALMMMLNAHTENDLTESFNGLIVSMLKRNFGQDCIISIETLRILEPIREHHNYIHGINMRKGKIMDNWPNEYIFVDRKSYDHPEPQSKLYKHL